MIYIILPVYNEADVIGILLERIDREMAKNNYGYRILAINDGSSDATASVIRQYCKKFPIELINFEKNRGVGEVMRTGLRLALEKSKTDEDVIVTMDADNTHDPRVIKMIINKIEEGYEVVIPSYLATGGMIIGLSFRRLFFSLAANFLYKISFYIKGINEYTGFYRGYKVGALKMALEKYKDKLIESNGFAAMAELLVKCRRVPLLITEVPLILRYDFKGEKSKLKVFPTILEHLKVIFSNLFKSRIV